MSPRTPRSDEHDGTDHTTTLPRRRVLALGAGLGVTLLAGCSGSTSSEPDNGEFRLLVSDQPADIADFDSLEVTFSDARVFPIDGNGTETPEPTTTGNETETTTQNGTATTTQNESATDAPETTEADTTAAPEDEEEADGEEDEDDEGDEDGFYTLDLESKTVDLTQVIGEDATSVFEGELEAGEYAKIELNVAAVDAIVEDEEVAVKVPSEKLQLTKPFEVSAEEPVEFVFDINVVKRGPMNGYILKPVISESGVAGRDVDYREVEASGTTSA